MNSLPIALCQLVLRSSAGVLAALCVCPVLAQSPLPAPITMPSVTVTTISPVAFQPLTVRAEFSTLYCISNDYPIFAQVGLKSGAPTDPADARRGLKSGVLSVALSHLRNGSCASSKSITLPGLPAGNYTLRISVTADDAGGIQVRRTYEAEMGQVNIVVSQPAGLGAAVMCMARVDLPAYGAYGTGPVMLTGRCSEEPSITNPRSSGTTPLEVGTATPSFMVYGALSGAIPQSLPTAFTPLYSVTYPAPFAGTFWTTSLRDCDALNQVWNGKSACDATTTVVLRAKNGVCPLGANPVYRSFSPLAVAHRYTLSADTYAALNEVGQVGEGLAWCALPLN